MNAGFEFLEHTADLGIRAWGPSFEAAFEQLGAAVIDLLGVGVDDGEPGHGRSISVAADDAGALAVGFVNELVFLCEEERGGVLRIDVDQASDRSIQGGLLFAAGDHQAHGLDVKAATYHRLAVERRVDGALEVQVYLDV